MDYSPFFISLKTSLCATAVAFIFGTAVARWTYGLKNSSFKAIVDGIFTLPLVLPPTVVGFCLLLFFGWNGPAGMFLRTLGYRLVFSWEATVLAAAVVAFPLIYRTMRASFEQIDSNIIDTARTLGLNERTIFFRVMLPNAQSGCVAAAVLGFARAMGEFGATLMLAGNIPGRTQTLPIAIWSAVEGNEMTTAAVWVTLMILLSFAVIYLLNTYTERH
ncbi:MAG: molybdate ABC transporter permease subunit [Planctomycetaceae bacterium]|jgi:molybdate transport system permease protein|nr:molybdate ABC transporter permease subunit [Planctomycetaceae bacterium]